MPIDAAEAGRRGGRSRSAAKIAAAKRNGFQRRKPAAGTATVSDPNSTGSVAAPQAVSRAVLIPVQKADEK